MLFRIFVVLLLVFSACSSSYSPEQYQSWLESDNDFQVKGETENITITCQLLPPEWMAYKQIKILQEDDSDSAFNALKSEYDKGSHFSMKLTPKKGLSSKDLYQANQSYLDFEIAKDLKLISDKDTVDCTLATLERTIGVKPYLVYQLSFDAPLSDNSKLIYRGLLSEQTIMEFNYKSSQLKSLPALKR